MKTMSLAGSRESPPRDISSIRNRYSCQQWTEKGKINILNMLTNFNISENKQEKKKEKIKGSCIFVAEAFDF